MTNIINCAKGIVLASALGVILVGTANAMPAVPFQEKENDIKRVELKNFDQFLDQHPEVAEQLRKNPSLINKEDYLEKHPELQEWMKNHPAAREELKENPRAFMKREKRFEKHEGPEKAQLEEQRTRRGH